MASKFSYAEAVKGSINTYYDLVIDINDSYNKTYGWSLGKLSKLFKFYTYFFINLGKFCILLFSLMIFNIFTFLFFLFLNFYT